MESKALVPVQQGLVPFHGHDVLSRLYNRLWKWQNPIT